MVVANGSLPDDAECADGGTPKVMFGAAEFLRGFDFVLKRRDLRSLLQGLLNEREGVQNRGSNRGELLNELKILFIRVAEDRRKGGERSLVIVMRFQQQEFSAGQVNPRETQIEFGLQLGVSERLDLVDEELAGVDHLLGHGHQRLGFQHIVKSLVHRQDDLGRGGCGILIFGLGLVFGAGEQVRGAAEIGDQLADGRASRGAWEKNRIVKATGGKAAPGIGVYRSDAEIGVGRSAERASRTYWRATSARSFPMAICGLFLRARASAWANVSSLPTGEGRDGAEEAGGLAGICARSGAQIRRERMQEANV